MEPENSLQLKLILNPLIPLQRNAKVQAQAPPENPSTISSEA